MYLCVQVLTDVLTDIRLCTSKFIYLFGLERRFQHCTGHIMMGSSMGRGRNQHIQLVKVLQ